MLPISNNRKTNLNLHPTLPVPRSLSPRAPLPMTTLTESLLLARKVALGDHVRIVCRRRRSRRRRRRRRRLRRLGHGRAGGGSRRSSPRLLRAGCPRPLRAARIGRFLAARRRFSLLPRTGFPRSLGAALGAGTVLPAGAAATRCRRRRRRCRWFYWRPSPLPRPPPLLLLLLLLPQI